MTTPAPFNRASSSSWLDWLTAHGVLAVGGIDTRALTRHIRREGALRAVVSTDDPDVSSLRRRAQKLPRMAGLDLASVVTCGEAAQTPAAAAPPDGGQELHVVALDFGIKRSIVGYLAAAGCRVTVMPAATPAREILKLAPDGVFLSNGPGDPDPLVYAHRTVAGLIQKYPVFGICMGNHMITHALGAKTFKLKFGHRGANQPVKNLETGKVSITAQNHGFAARPADLEQRGAVVTEINLNDGTVEGLRHRELPVFSVQYHPEASPGPHDADPLFVDFYRLIEQRKAGRI